MASSGCGDNRLVTLDDIINCWSAKLLATPALAQSLSANYQFVAHADGRRLEWFLKSLPTPTVALGRIEAQCEIEADFETIVGMANREINPQLAFVLGKVKVRGEVEPALRLYALWQ